MLLGLLACVACARNQPAAAPPPARVACALPAPEVLHADGAVVTYRWELGDADRWLAAAPRVGPATEALRAAIRARVPDVSPDAILDRQIARYAGTADPVELGEVHNATLVRSRRGGRLRAMTCLEAALYELQTTRFPQASHPTELQAFVLRHGARLAVYFIAGDRPFPPKATHAMPAIERELAAGWRLWAHVHNHTFEFTDDRHAALGTPAPSTNDVHYYKNVAEELRLERIVVINGFDAVELSVAELALLQGR